VCKAEPVLSSASTCERTLGALLVSGGKQFILSAAHKPAQCNIIKGTGSADVCALKHTVYDIGVYSSPIPLEESQLQSVFFATSIQSCTEGIRSGRLNNLGPITLATPSGADRKLVFEGHASLLERSVFRLAYPGFVVTYFHGGKFVEVPLEFDCRNDKIGLLVVRDDKPELLPIVSLYQGRFKTKLKSEQHKAQSRFFEEQLIACLGDGFSVKPGDSGATLVYYCEDKCIVIGFLEALISPKAGSSMNDFTKIQ
jgi:hypothetical protein